MDNLSERLDEFKKLIKDRDFLEGEALVMRLILEFSATNQKKRCR